jgi:hypothetical protein
VLPFGNMWDTRLHHSPDTFDHTHHIRLECEVLDFQQCCREIAPAYPNGTAPSWARVKIVRVCVPVTMHVRIRIQEKNKTTKQFTTQWAGEEATLGQSSHLRQEDLDGLNTCQGWSSGHDDLCASFLSGSFFATQ